MHLLFLAGVAGDVELVEQVDQDHQVGVDGLGGHGLGAVHAVVNEKGRHQNTASHDELQQLSLGEVLLQRRVKAKGGEHVVGVHQGVNEGVEDDQHHSCTSVLRNHESPARKHNAGMVEGLEKHGLSTFQQDNP